MDDSDSTFAVVIWAIIGLIFVLRVSGELPNPTLSRLGFATGYPRVRIKAEGLIPVAPRSFQGRAGRSEWWSFMIAYSVLGWLFGMISEFGWLLAIPWTIGVWAVSVRRLHDMNRSGWWQMTGSVIVIGSVGIAKLLVNSEYYSTMSPSDSELFETSIILLGAIGALIVYAWIGFSPGTNGPNAYGEADIET